MSIDPRRRQKRLARKAAKHKAQVAKKRRMQQAGAAFPAKIAAGHPIHECLMSGDLFETGLGHVIVSRRVGAGVAAGFFLVDVYCLGVKDAAFSLYTPGEYEAALDRLTTRQLREIEPACARKLIEGAVAYAGNLGIRPHKDYYKAAPILGDLDTDRCSQDFEYGKDGLPLYIPGPYDSPARITLIRRILEDRCGRDGYHFILGGTALELDQDPDWFDEEEDGDDVEGAPDLPGGEEGETHEDPDR